jgi:hypothetical protein
MLSSLPRWNPAVFGNFLKTSPCCCKPGLLAGKLLEAAKGLVAIGRIELDKAGVPAGLFRRDQRRAGAPKRIEHGLDTMPIKLRTTWTCSMALPPFDCFPQYYGSACSPNQHIIALPC